MESRTSRRHWVRLVPYGLNQQDPNNFNDIFASFCENRDNLRYAWRILRNGCCELGAREGGSHQ